MAVGKPVLAGVGVLVTRPAHQAERLARLIEADGGRAIRFPTIEIAAPADSAQLRQTIEGLADIDIAIFISPNAVTGAFELMRAHGRTLPARSLIAAVGEATARELAQHGIAQAAIPARFDSEGLLAMPELASIAGKRVAIFRGAGGRELLGATLTARGAHVAYAECYRRLLPQADSSALAARWARGEIDVVSITSAEGLRNLHAMLGAAAAAWLVETPVIVVSTAQAAACRELALTHAPIVARAPSDEAILEAIRAWHLRRTSL